MSDESGDRRDFEIALADMARDLLAQKTLQATLDRVVAYAVQLVDGCEHAGILLLHQGNQLTTPAATSDLVRESDRAQHELGEGPCFDTLHDQYRVHRIADMATHSAQWTRFAPRAHELGIGSMLGLLLYTDQEELGALNLYSTQRQVFTESSERVGWLLASHAAVLYSAARTHSQLETAVASRREIGEALGLVRATYHLGDEQALQLLKKVSQDRHMKLRDLAQAINAGELALS